MQASLNVEAKFVAHLANQSDGLRGATAEAAVEPGVAQIDAEEQVLTVTFDGRPVEYDFGELDELMLSYAVTIHKSQGSEYPCVVIPLHMQHYMLLQRNLLYTAITRGRKLVCVVGSAKAVGIAIRNNEVRERRTTLRERLAGELPSA